MSHDFLQETMFVVHKFKSPLAFTIADFFACAFFPYLQLVTSQPRINVTSFTQPFHKLFSSRKNVYKYSILGGMMVTSCLLAVTITYIYTHQLIFTVVDFSCPLLFCSIV